MIVLSEGFQLGTWLKSSVPGIILLGAAGSVVAVLATRVVRWMFVTVLPKRYERIRRAYKRLEYRAGYMMGFLSASNDVGRLLLYFSYRLAKTVAAVGGVVLFALLYVVLRGRSDGGLTWLSYFALVGMFASLYAVASSLFWFWIDHRYVIQPLLSRARLDAKNSQPKKRGPGENTAVGPTSPPSPVTPAK